MDELLSLYFTVDRLGPALTFLVVAAIFASVKHSERIKPGKKTDG